MRFKKSAIVIGILVGITAGVTAMLPTSRSAEALVLVKDESNIAEAIKTALTTANILTQEQQQLALQILNMQQLSPSKIIQLLQDQKARQNEVLDEKGAYDGILSPNTSVPTFWNEELGTVEDVVNGNKTLVDLFSQTQKGLKAIDKTNKDAAQTAKFVQEQNALLGNTVTDALNTSNQAVGNLQAVQAGNSIAAAQAQATIEGNQLLSTMAAAQAARNQREAVQEAMSHQINQASSTNLENFVNSMTNE